MHSITCTTTIESQGQASSGNGIAMNDPWRDRFPWSDIGFYGMYVVWCIVCFYLVHCVAFLPGMQIPLQVFGASNSMGRASSFPLYLLSHQDGLRLVFRVNSRCPKTSTWPDTTQVEVFGHGPFNRKTVHYPSWWVSEILTHTRNFPNYWVQPCQIISLEFSISEEWQQFS